MPRQRKPDPEPDENQREFERIRHLTAERRKHADEIDAKAGPIIEEFDRRREQRLREEEINRVLAAYIPPGEQRHWIDALKLLPYPELKYVEALLSEMIDLGP